MANKDSGIVNIHGKEYFTVAKRVGMFREGEHRHGSIVTEIVSRDENCVVMKATILNDAGRVLATGHSEEYRADGKINATSALENSETSAIGRALASLGLGGTEFASADEVANAITNKKPYQSVAKDTWDELDDETRKFLANLADQVRQVLETQSGLEAMKFLEEQRLEPDEKVGLWSLFNSKERAAMEPHKRPKKAA
jgi:hypothetical protein